MKFEQEKGEHFFRSTLVQTLFYGVFSAWVLWHKANPLRQVLKQWLSYRGHSLLGRPLTPEEVREVTHTRRRLAGLLLLQPVLDAKYQCAKANGFPWA